MNLSGAECGVNLLRARENDVVPQHFFLGNGQVVTTHHDILRRCDDRVAVCRREDVVGRKHQVLCFELRFNGEWQVHGHLVTVEVRIESLADQRVNKDCITLDQYRLESLDSHTVKSRRTVQHHRVTLSHLFENVPNLIVLALQHLLRALDGIGITEFLEPANNERLEKLQSDLLGQSTLVQLQLRANRNNGTGGVVHALTKEILTETSLLALDHVGQGLERTVV